MQQTRYGTRAELTRFSNVPGKMMQNFDELCRLFQSFRIRNRDYEMSAAQFLRNFAAEIAKQIGAPDTFSLPILPPEQSRKTICYVRPLLFDPETDKVDPLGPHDCLLWDDSEGAWAAGVGIHLELTKNSFPKTEFVVRLKFKLRDDDIDLTIPPSGEFRLKNDDRSSWQPAIEHIINRLVHMFNLAYEPNEKIEIGFVRFVRA